MRYGNGLALGPVYKLAKRVRTGNSDIDGAPGGVRAVRAGGADGLIVRWAAPAAALRAKGVLTAGEIEAAKT